MPTTHVRELTVGNFSLKSFVLIRLFGMMVLTVRGAMSSTLPLFFEELRFLEEEAIAIKKEERVFTKREDLGKLRTSIS